MFGGNYAPRYCALTNGQIMPISQNQALFSLLGTTYGGNGVTTFALPNVQCNVPVHYGQGIGLSPYALGQTGGVPTVTLTQQQLPAHTHQLFATSTNATTSTIDTTVLPATPTGTDETFYCSDISGKQPVVPAALDPSSCTMQGQSQPHDNIMPVLCISFVIALSGIFPSRN
jgi:microcystin-dependent protein